eukprot:353426-Chlamydomonas_euryale.AAC.7
MSAALLHMRCCYRALAHDSHQKRARCDSVQRGCVGTRLPHGVHACRASCCCSFPLFRSFLCWTHPQEGTHMFQGHAGRA